jgi:hypothetical protein
MNFVHARANRRRGPPNSGGPQYRRRNSRACKSTAHNKNNTMAIGALIYVKDACSDSKAVGGTQPTALPSSPIRAPFSWTAVVGLSRPGSEASRNFTSVPNLPFQRGGTVLVRPRKNSEIIHAKEV